MTSAGNPFVPYDDAARRACLRAMLPELMAGGSPYHAGWVALQLLGLISGLDSERGALVQDLRGIDATRPLSSVYIAGSADCGLLSVVHEAFGDRAAKMNICVVDRSPVPLKVCQRYAETMGFEISITEGDLASNGFAPKSDYDVVIAHSLLSFVRAEERAKMLQHLVARIAPAGSLLLYQSVRPAQHDSVLRYSRQETETLVARGLAAHAQAGYSLDGCSLEAVATLVREFCAAKQTFAVDSKEELETMICQAGLSLARCTRLFDATTTRHRAATPHSHYVKYALLAQRLPK